ncbi:hypothetical protein [Falsirhodobacter halotolerans]|uniref:hypothetical protein n=1 Tax=Falsirhodobacter halotolerans TaxID=1146892 RepID=UPI001FD02A59|nr:hypothetical protein [Falsirhodobacter halotolerans]MCJ8139936.1 hypothetical protein [Falsirhodobacter halotolerans]
MARRKATDERPRRREIYATDSEWGRITILARDHGLSISRYLVERPDPEVLPSIPRTPQLALAVARMHAEIEDLAAMVNDLPGALRLLPRLVAVERVLISLAQDMS